MGQAKRRGTFEQRKAGAVVRRAEERERRRLAAIEAKRLRREDYQRRIDGPLVPLLVSAALAASL